MFASGLQGPSGRGSAGEVVTHFVVTVRLPTTDGIVIEPTDFPHRERREHR
jgi:hypothetical protein